MTDAPSTTKTLADLTVGIPGAGRRTLLAALPELAEARFPGNFRLCLLDAERMDAPAQLALLKELAADDGLELLFALNKVDKAAGLRTAMTRALGLLRERGFAAPSLYPICAAAAKAFGLPAGAELHPKQLAAQGEYYYRFGPGENNLSAFASTGEHTRPLGSWEVTPRQLRLALLNTGVPALGAALEARRAETRDQGSGIKDQSTEEAPAGAASGRPPEEETPAGAASGRPPEEETPAGAASGRPPEEEAPAGAASGRPPEEEAPAGAASGRPPEAEASEPEPVEPEPAETEIPLPEADPVEERIDAFLEYLDSPEEGPESVPEPAPETDAELIPEAVAETTETNPETTEPAPDTTSETIPAAPSDPLKALLARAETADCAGLLELARSVPAVDASVELRDQTLDALHAAYQTRQIQELDALTLGADALDLESLRALGDRIAKGPYTVQTRTPYAARINRRMDELQSAALEELCAGVEEADARDLARIRAALEGADCADLLKTEHYRRIEARQEALDLEALERVTAGAESMSEKELRAVAVTLEANNWNPKFVTSYRHRIELCREAAVCREVEQELTELDDMERREVLAARERILQKELPARFTAPALSRIDEKLFRLDMLRLLALNKDFDRLDFEDIDELRAAVGRGDYCDKAKRHYLQYVLARENALILENTSARVELTRQLIAHHKLRSGDFTLASAGEDYQSRLAEFWDGTGLEQPRDIPVFLFENGSQYAMTATRFYFKVGRHLDYLPLENIARFQGMKQHLSLFLQIVGKDNSYRLTEARINRSGSERTLEFLNDCVARWADPGPAAPLPAALRVRMPEDVQTYTAPVEREPLSPRMAWEIFCRAYAEAGLREGNLIRLEDPGAMERLPRLRLSLGLPENTPVIWYKSASRLGPVKEGVALGAKGIYLKEAKLPLKTIPMQEIFSVQAVGSKRAAVTTLQNETVQLGISDDMALLIADYVRAVQLSAWLFSREEQA